MPETRAEVAAAEEEPLKTIVQDAVTAANAGMHAAVTAAVTENKEAISNKFELIPFQGNITDNFDDWLKRFNRLGQANNWDDDRKKNVLP